MANVKELIINELKKGVTQRDLAKKIGFSHSTIQKILFTDTKNLYETRKKVADYFRIPVAQFYDSESDPVPEYKARSAPPASENETTTLLLKSICARLESIERELFKRDIEKPPEAEPIRKASLGQRPVSAQKAVGGSGKQ